MRRIIRLSERGIIIIFIFFSAFSVLWPQSSSWQDELKLAQFYQKNKQIEEALYYYQKAFDASGHSAKVYNSYYRFLSSVKAYEKAEEISRIMLSQNPGHQVYVNNTALAVAFQERYEQAYRIWSDYLKKYGKNWAIYMTVSNQMIHARMFDYAIRTLEEAYRKFPSQHQLLLQIANMYQWRLSYVEATKKYLLYLMANPKQFLLIQSRILSMLDEYEDARPVIDYLNSFPQNKVYREITSSILLKFRKYDTALPLMIENYEPARFTRYLSYAKEAQKRGYSEFAERLINFLYEKESSDRRRLQLRLLQTELAVLNLSDTAPTDSAIMLAETLEQLYPKLDTREKLKTEKLLIEIYRDNLNDYDKARVYISRGISLSKNSRDRDYFQFDLAELDFRLGNYRNALKNLRKITRPDYKARSYFYQLLSLYGLNGLSVLEKNLAVIMKNVKSTDLYFNDFVQIEIVNSGKDSSLKKMVMDGILNYYGHRYARAEKNFAEALEMGLASSPVTAIIFEKLSQASVFTGSDIFVTQALKYISQKPAEEINPRLLWILADRDHKNSRVYMEKILDNFPDSPEAAKVRSYFREKGIM